MYCPLTREGFGLVITEALWKGKPAIAANVGAVPLQIRDGDTGYFCQTPRETAQKFIHLLEDTQAAEIIVKRGKEYVGEHFLLPDRIADCLMAIYMTMNWHVDNKSCADCVVSFHPWFKLSKR